MGTRGPAPTPSAILRDRGSWRGKRNKAEPAPLKKAPLCPKWFDKDRRAVWKQVVPMLAKMGVLTVADGAALERYCDAIVRWRKASALLAEKGEVFTVRGDDGKVKYIQQLPYVSIVAGLAALLANIEAQFGMTPSARTRITVEVEQPKKQGGFAALKLTG